MRKLDKYFQIVEEDRLGHRVVIAGGKTKEIALDALRMMDDYRYCDVNWNEPFTPHNMTGTEVIQGIVRF